jgi:hypothetical protein
VIALLLACAARRPSGEAVLPEAPADAPGDPASILQDAVAGPDPQLKARALTALAMADPALAVAALDDEDAVVRVSAARALARSDAGRNALRAWAAAADVATPGLADVCILLGDEGTALAAGSWSAAPSDARAALAAVAARVDPDAASFLGRWLQQTDLPWEPDLFAWIGDSGATVLVDPLTEAGASAEPEVARALLAARDALGDRTARSALRKALAEADELSRLAFVERALRDGPADRLGVLAGDDAAARLARVAEQPSAHALADLRAEDEDVAEIAAPHLSAWTGGSPPRAACRRWIDDAGTGRSRTRAAWTSALALCGDRGEDALRGLLADESRSVRVAAAAALFVRDGTPP